MGYYWAESVLKEVPGFPKMRVNPHNLTQTLDFVAKIFLSNHSITEQQYNCQSCLSRSTQLCLFNFTIFQRCHPAVCPLCSVFGICSVIIQLFSWRIQLVDYNSAPAMLTKMVRFESIDVSRCWVWKKIKTGIKLNLMAKKVIYLATTSSSKLTRLYSFNIDFQWCKTRKAVCSY